MGPHHPSSCLFFFPLSADSWSWRRAVMLLLSVAAQWEQKSSADLPARRWVKVLHRASCGSSLLLEHITSVGMAEFCPSWTVLDTVRHHARASSPFCSPADYRHLSRPIVRSNRTEYMYSHQPLYLLFISVGLMVWGFIVADHVHCYVSQCPKMNGTFINI